MAGEKVDLLFCNEAEAMGWADTDNLDVTIERLKDVARGFAITLGARGAITWDGATLSEIPPRKVNAVDTNGAGDMFAGAFLYAITHGEDFATAGRFASLAAGQIVASYGPRLKADGYDALKQEFFGKP
jgi:sugar/nucleoside kinase (ribokinase family)